MKNRSEKVIESICSLLEANRSRGYKQVEVNDIVKAFGGEQKVKSSFTNSDDAYKSLIKVASRLYDDLLQRYGEVGEVDPTRLQDYVDDRFPRKSYDEVVEKSRQYPKIKNLVKLSNDALEKKEFEKSKKLDRSLQDFVKSILIKEGGLDKWDAADEASIITKKLLGIQW